MYVSNHVAAFFYMLLVCWILGLELWAASVEEEVAAKIKLGQAKLASQRGISVQSLREKTKAELDMEQAEHEAVSREIILRRWDDVTKQVVRQFDDIAAHLYVCRQRFHNITKARIKQLEDIRECRLQQRQAKNRRQKKKLSLWSPTEPKPVLQAHFLKDHEAVLSKYPTNVPSSRKDRAVHEKLLAFAEVVIGVVEYQKILTAWREYLQPFIDAVEKRTDRMLYNYI